MIPNYHQIWINIQGKDIHETLYGIKIGNGLLKNKEIPFISKRRNYHDILMCSEDEKGKITFIQVVKPSGFTTIHTMFAKEIEMDEKKVIINDL